MFHGRLFGDDPARLDEHRHAVQWDKDRLCRRPLEGGPREPVHPLTGREPHLLAGDVTRRRHGVNEDIRAVEVLTRVGIGARLVRIVEVQRARYGQAGLVGFGGQGVGVGHQSLPQAQEVTGDLVGRLGVVPGQAVAGTGVQAHHGLERAQLHPAGVQVGVVLRRAGRWAEEAADVVAHVRLANGGFIC